jgi:intein-encoded DNA endonuclease-like protein
VPIFKAKNENFFRKWSPEMAYILGFFAADGNMLKNKRGAHFIEFQITDRDLLIKIRNSNHKITARKRNNKWRTSYRLQIGSKQIFKDLLKLGLTPKKSKTINLPNIPEKYFYHFVRGYFDGDGNVIFGFFKKSDRKTKSPALLTRFTAGSKSILEKLHDVLTNTLDTRGSLCYCGDAWRLSYSTNDSKKLFSFMYNSGNVAGLIYLKRKFILYKKANLGR